MIGGSLGKKYLIYLRSGGLQAEISSVIFGSLSGGIAQLVERLHGMQEVSGSIPLTSTRIKSGHSL